MIFVSFLRWWYSRGWAWFAKSVLVTKNIHIIQFFSIPTLLKTLFSPFRQDTLNTKKAPASIKLQAFGMNIISRVMGALIRSTLIIVGFVLVLLNTITSSLMLIIWPFMPLSPVLAVVLMALSVGVGK